MRASLTEKRPKRADSGPIWIRQAGEGHESLIGAVRTSEDGMTLTDVTAFVFDPSGAFLERIDAKTARFEPGAWQIENAVVTRLEHKPKKEATYRLPTTLTSEQVRETFDNLDAISFWELPRLIDSAQRAGLPSTRYELRYNTLLSRPFVLLAMVLIAAIVSLRFSRSREVGNMILAGVGVGFMLYVVSKIAWDLGSGGIVPPLLAAWLPAIVTLLMGATALLHLEDG
jgi:lipopolysaccharide export system permease protein